MEPSKPLPELGNLGLQPITFVSPQLRAVARRLDDDQVMELTKRIRERVARISDEMQQKFARRKAKLDDKAVFDVHVNKARAEAMHHVELQRKLRPGDVECDILKDMIIEQQYRQDLLDNCEFGDVQEQMDEWFEGTKFQGVTMKVSHAWAAGFCCP